MEVPDCRAPEIAVHPPIRSPIEKQGQEMLNLQDTLLKLKRQILESRASSIKVKLVGNGKMLETSTSQLSVMADTRNELHTMNLADTTSMLSYRIGNPLYKANGTISGSLEKENISTQEELLSSTIALGNNSDGKCSVCCIKLPYVEKVPRYTTWIFLARNQKMAEDQSVVGRRQICYDCHGGETIMCSDSEGELAELEEIKHEFSEGEDRILWKAIYEHGDSSEVYANLKDFIDATTSEIKERYDALMRKRQGDHADDSVHSVVKKSERQLFLERTLDAALDSFDNLFCRRCLVFDCRPHGCSQNLVFSGEQLPFSVDSEDTSKPCSKECYLWRIGQNSSYALSCKEPVKGKKHISMTECGGDPSTVRFGVERVTNQFGKKAEKRKVFESENQNLENSKIAAEESFEITEKKLKNTTLDETVASESSQAKGESPYKIRPCIIDASSTKIHTNTYSGSPIVKSASDRSKAQNYSKWNPIEKDLYMKGVEIFGKNSCLITRNLLSGLKTCVEVWDYMFTDGVNISNGSTMTSFGMESDANDSSCMEQEIPSRSRIWRRRGRNRKLKYTWKSTGHPSIRKRIADGKEKCKQYVPCGCQQACGKQCPCIENATCCEKYCGCSKSCKNRFRGCHCAKSQCRSRQCPCFAANRECDPDVCRNCWVSCGDSSVDACPTRGDVYQCGNMKLLLKQQERILLGRSDVAGWGAFIKNPVNKNDYLGEYTGELISHKEADKRGKIYDRANSSFLFDLNDEYVLDAYRKGDKLKFANHSSNPNCYAKVVLVAGDHRVGIFAKDHIDAGEELFYDYRYGPDQAPVWARKPEGSKRDDSSSSHSRRAHKVA